MLEIRCSGLARPMTCAGSLFFTDLPPQEKNPAAEEGTAAGELLRHYLEKPNMESGTHASNGVAFDDDMRFFCKPIADEIFANAGSEILCEQRIDWQTRSGIWIRGQYDVSYIGKDGALYVDDLKYGWGIVEPKENWQLIGYAVGEVLRRGRAFDKIVLRIHQPRPHHEDGPVRAWSLTYKELIDYKEKIEARMSAIANGLRELVTSPKCKYCPAAAEACPAIGKQMHYAIEYAQEFVQDKLSEVGVARQLEIIERFQEVLKIKYDSLKDLAVNRIKSGKIIPGYVTEANYGDRKWKRDIDPAAIEMLTGKVITEKVMLSPAKTEKLGVPKDFVNALVERPFLGQKLKKKDASSIGDKIFGKPKGE